MGWIGTAEIAFAVFVGLAALLAVLVVRERKARRHFQILAAMAAVSDAGGSLEETFDAICAVLVPDFADFCMIDLIADDGQVERAAVRLAPGAWLGVEEGMAGRRPSVPGHMVAGSGAASLEPRFYEKMTDDDLRELADGTRDLELLRRLGPRSAVTVALNARGRVTGALTLGVGWSGRRYRREHARFAWILSGRVALALDNCGLFADLERAERARAEIAETLQRGLLPSPLPHIPGWSVAATYRPAGAHNEVGGDFYDAFKVPGGWMLVIGDVTGRGAHAASIAALARYTLRTAAVLTGDPVAALDTVNRALLARGDAALCSVAAVVLGDDPLQPVRLAVAGHPPPLLVEGEEVSEVAPSDPVLGAFPDAEWAISRSEVQPGRQLVIVTDGIAEAQGPEGRFGEDRLREELSSASNPALATQRLEGALHSFTGGSLDDDVAILAIERISSEPLPPSADMALDDRQMGLVESLYDSFNRRDEAGIAAICDEEMEFFPLATAEAIGREAPYVGPAGLQEYMADVAQVWEELLITPSGLERRGECLLVRGRVYARSRELGIRDVPVAWIWEVRSDRFVRGEAFPDPEQAVARFAAGEPQSSLS
ncbi:MAG TPA: SpoIIE family protein phosphatase [Solirubrobacterales bacterium]|nr:SpoIIE family protein phosphatase [Solirubrobacterales bacterium]